MDSTIVGRPWRILGTALVLLLAAAACGSSDETADTTTTTTATTATTTDTTDTTTTTTTTATTTNGPTRAEFIANADQICRGAQEVFAGVELDSSVTRDDIVALVTGLVLPELRSELDQLNRLERPAEDEAAITAILAAFEDGIDAVETEPLSLLVAEPFATTQELASDYGFQDCGSFSIPELPGGDSDAPSTGQLTPEQRAVADVVEEFFDGLTDTERGLELLEDSERLAGVLAETGADPITQALSTIVTDVTFPDDAACAEQGLQPGCAAAVHDVLLGETVVSPGDTTYLLMEDGAWKVSAESFCAFVERGGFSCPES